jgi:hypothetical protein
MGFTGYCRDSVDGPERWSSAGQGAGAQQQPKRRSCKGHVDKLRASDFTMGIVRHLNTDVHGGRVMSGHYELKDSTRFRWCFERGA